jgi:hypothetical protein
MPHEQHKRLPQRLLAAAEDGFHAIPKKSVENSGFPIDGLTQKSDGRGSVTGALISQDLLL